MAWLSVFRRRQSTVVRNVDWEPALHLPGVRELGPRELLERGHDEFRRHHCEAAHCVYSLAYHVAKRKRDQAGQGRALAALADIAMHFCPHHLGDPWARRAWLSERAVSLLRRVGDRRGLASALMTRASCHWDDRGAEDLDESLTICQREGDTDGVLQAYSRMATQCALHKDTQQAMALSRRAIDIARVLGDPETIACELLSYGIIFEGIAKERIAIFEEAAMLFGQLSQKGRQMRCLFFCAVLGADEDDRTTQRRYLLEMLPLAREVAAHDPVQLSLCLDRLVDVERATANDELAEFYAYERAQLPEDDIGFPEDFMDEVSEAFEQEGAIGGQRVFERWSKTHA